MDILILLTFVLSNMMCFIVGARVGQKVVKGEEVQMPTVNPMEAYREHQARKEAEVEKNRIDTILRNIDNYNGTPDRQEEVR